MDVDWHPWEYVGERFPHIIICTSYELESGVRGLAQGNRIWLCKTLDQAGRRTTLSHEILHFERGIVPQPRHSMYTRREERIVDRLAARRLIPLPKLIDALRWSSQPAELADALWTTERMVECRMNALDPIEVAELENSLDDGW
jgi:hypothetical protein